MGLRQNSGMDRPAVIQTYGSVWIICVLVWIGGMDRPVGSGYGSGLYILTRSHIYICVYIIYVCVSVHTYMCMHGGMYVGMSLCVLKNPYVQVFVSLPA
jgi:hypothetical protein